ncbi:DUF4446 family protein [Nocardioides sp. GY 10127]|uniref:DUF4446 family protein n=1 Tax=Nocardioides sp. GY 10127 TaxID=2569762 RepID=UPI0010A8FE1E|nr:DUF4446 family protein [Nocardioides sp. GY 10127]TIC82706.1 DUF4446 family protein [Nocardioides sp. GY 10127]
MSDSAVSVLILVVAVLALLLALLALVLAVVAAQRTARAAALRRREPRTELPTDVAGLRAEVSALRAENADALRHLAVVRYDAFGDMGGHLSWSLALLDDGGNGVVLTSIHGRSEARTYAKPVADWASDMQLSPEEVEAVRGARP